MRIIFQWVFFLVFLGFNTHTIHPCIHEKYSIRRNTTAADLNLKTNERKKNTLQSAQKMQQVRPKAERRMRTRECLSRIFFFFIRLSRALRLGVREGNYTILPTSSCCSLLDQRSLFGQKKKAKRRRDKRANDEGKKDVWRKKTKNSDWLRSSYAFSRFRQWIRCQVDVVVLYWNRWMIQALLHDVTVGDIWDRSSNECDRNFSYRVSALSRRSNLSEREYRLHVESVSGSGSEKCLHAKSNQTETIKYQIKNLEDVMHWVDNYWLSHEPLEKKKCSKKTSFAVRIINFRLKVARESQAVKCRVEGPC